MRGSEMTGFLCVGAGGAAGAMLRYALSLFPYKGTFPVLTLITNVLGALAIGAIAGAAARRGLSAELVLFLKTGVCGGFTTFSTFSLETYELLNQGHYGTALLYMAASLVLCLAGVAAGMFLTERIG